MSADIVDYWFRSAASRAEKLALWFGTSADVDRDMRERFESQLARAAGAELDSLALGTPHEVLGRVLLLDQVPRNIYRGTPRAFELDGKGLALMRMGVDRQIDDGYALIERMFFYFPLMHSESLADQQEMVDRMVAIEPAAGTADHELWELFMGGARDHHRVIARFGRFPHRNAILGRESTAEERDYLGEVRARARPAEHEGGTPFELSQGGE